MSPQSAGKRPLPPLPSVPTASTGLKPQVPARPAALPLPSAAPGPAASAGAPSAITSAPGYTPQIFSLAAQIRLSMSSSERLTAKVKRTNLNALLGVIDKLNGVKHPELKRPLMAELQKVAGAYLASHQNPDGHTEKMRRAAVEEIEMVAIAHNAKQEVMDRYERDMASTKLRPGETPRGDHAAARPFEHLTSAVAARSNGQLYGALPGKTDQPLVGDAEMARAIAVEAGLSVPEVMALVTYTGGDYKYMNPALTGWRPGLDESAKFSHIQGAGAKAEAATSGPINVKKEAAAKARSDASQAYAAMTEKEKDALAQGVRNEGLVQSAVVVQALRKLPARPCKTFRGDSFTLDRMNQLYSVGQAASNTLLLSTSRDINRAASFAYQGRQAVKVVVEFDITDGGRDVAMFSQVPSEQEVLVLPGVSFQTVSIERYDLDKRARSPLVGAPTVDRVGFDAPCYYITVKQV